MKPVRFLDPLYRFVDIDEQDRDLVFSPEFQRLRYVRLCNINSLYITGASEPSRFEHCLGVYHLARRWVQRLGLPTEDAAIVRAAALLHDLQTGPFGHSLQYVLEDNEESFDEQFQHANLQAGASKNFHQRTESGASFSGRPFSTPGLLGPRQYRVAEAVSGKGQWGPIISGTLDLDNLDNVVRLAFHVGLTDDSDRRLPMILVDHLTLRNGVICTNDLGRSLIERWYYLRAELYRYLLLDPGEFSAKAMLTYAVEHAATAKLLWEDDWKLTDDELIEKLEHLGVGDNQTIGQTIKRLRIGDLFETIGIWTTTDTALYDRLSAAQSKREFESKIEIEAQSSGLERLRVCLHLILDVKKTRRSIPFFDPSSGEMGIVGTDSGELHVGLFAMNSRSAGISPRTLDAYKTVFGRVISGFSKAQFGPSEDPLFVGSLANELQPTLL